MAKRFSPEQSGKTSRDFAEFGKSQLKAFNGRKLGPVERKTNRSQSPIILNEIKEPTKESAINAPVVEVQNSSKLSAQDHLPATQKESDTEAPVIETQYSPEVIVQGKVPPTPKEKIELEKPGIEFCQKLAKHFESSVIRTGKPSARLLERLYKIAYSGNQIFEGSNFALENIAIEDFSKLISLIAEKAYLNLLVREELREIEGLKNSNVIADLKEVRMRAGGLSGDQGRIYTNIDGAIARLAIKITIMGLPSDKKFTFGNIIIKTRNLDDDLKGESIFNWKLPKWVQLTGVAGAGVATMISCTAQPPAEVAPLPTESAPAEAPAGAQEEVDPAQIDIDISKITGEITPTPEAPTEEASNDEPTALTYPTEFSEWTDVDDYVEDRVTIESLAPIDLKNAEVIIRDQAKIQGINVQEVLVKTAGSRWTVVIRDTNGLIWFAVGKDTNLPYAQLFPFGETVDQNGERRWKLASNPLNEAGNYQDVLENNLFFTIIEKDKDGNPIEWMSLEDGTMVEIDKGVKWTVVENIENGANNPLNDADMAPGGRVDQYLEQLKPKLMAETNWDIIKDDIPFKLYGGMMIYIPKSNVESIKFANPEKDPSVPDTNPFDRDIDAFGLYTAGNGRKYTFIPLVIRDTNAPTESGHDIYFMKLLLPHQKDDGTPLSQFEIDFMFENWNNRMNIAPIGYGNSTNGWKWDANENPDGDPMFDYLKKGSPEFELWTSVFIALGKQEPVHGPLSELKKLEGKVFLTEAPNFTNEDGSESNILK